MLERYTEAARRTIFFARYEGSALGSDAIGTQHLLLGLFRADSGLALRFLKSEETLSAIRAGVESHASPGKPVPASMDLPLSHESKGVLVFAAEEAERLGHETIGSGHLLLGLLREDGSVAAAILREQGLQISEIREEIGRAPESPAPRTGAKDAQDDLRRLIEALPEDRRDVAARILNALGSESVGIAVAGPGVCFSVSYGAASAVAPAAAQAPRYTESARHSLFFARYEACQFGSAAIHTEHLLLGILRSDKDLGVRLLGSVGMIEEIRTEIEARTRPRRKVRAEVDLPLSEESRRALVLAGQELGSPHGRLGPAHLLAGMLRIEECFAATLLKRHGLTLERIRQEIPRPFRGAA